MSLTIDRLSQKKEDTIVYIHLLLSKVPCIPVALARVHTFLGSARTHLA